MLLAADIAVDQEPFVTVMIAIFVFTCFWCTPTHVKSKPSSGFALRNRLPKLVYKTCAHKIRGSYPIYERLVEVCSW